MKTANDGTRTSLLAVAACAMGMASAPGGAQAPPPGGGAFNPAAVAVTVVAHSGPGCASGPVAGPPDAQHVGAKVAVDASAFALFYRSTLGNTQFFRASYGYSPPPAVNGAGSSPGQRACAVDLGIRAPKGWSFAIAGVTYEGRWSRGDGLFAVDTAFRMGGDAQWTPFPRVGSFPPSNRAGVTVYDYKTGTTVTGQPLTPTTPLRYSVCNASADAVVPVSVQATQSAAFKPGGPALGFLEGTPYPGWVDPRVVHTYTLAWKRAC